MDLPKVHLSPAKRALPAFLEQINRRLNNRSPVDTVDDEIWTFDDCADATNRDA